MIRAAIEHDHQPDGERIQPNQIQVQINLSKASPGYNIFPIEAGNITLPPGVLLTKVEPRVVEMDIDTFLTKAFPVQVDWVGKLDENLILTSASPEPAKVSLKGNSRVLNQIETVYTEKVRLDPIKASGALTIGLAVGQQPVTVAPGAADKIQVPYVVKQRKPAAEETGAGQ